MNSEIRTETRTESHTGWVFHERYLWHDTGTSAGFLPSGGWLQPNSHVESIATKERFASLMAVSGLTDKLTRLEVRPATDGEIVAVHDPEYLAELDRRSADRGGDAGDGTTPFGAGSAEIARLSAGGVITAVNAVLAGDVDNAYALVRPPGHHAGTSGGMGFCMLNNTAIAIRSAQKNHGLERVAVVDWDVHHGNGTQQIFYSDPNVLTISLHQDRCFPTDQGFVSERGEGAGYGANVNVPLPPGSGEAAYLHAMSEVVLPALRRFAPQLVIVGCGFDAGQFDPMARMLLTSESFRKLTEILLEETGGQLAMVHEGGYSDFYVPFMGVAVVEQLSGIKTAVEDPYLNDADAGPGNELSEPQRQAVAEAAAAWSEAAA